MIKKLLTILFIDVNIQKKWKILIFLLIFMVPTIHIQINVVNTLGIFKILLIEI